VPAEELVLAHDAASHGERATATPAVGSALPRHARELSRQTRLPARWADPLLDRMYPWAPTAWRAPDGGWVAPLTVQSVRVGDIALAACGAELFTATGQRIKAASPATRTLVAGYANGMLGYVAPAEDHALGGYEVELSPFLYRLPGTFAASSEATLRAALAEQLAALFAH
jgi:neutral ceramidase